MSRYFYDCEFLQNGSGKVDLVSIGIVRENGDTFYSESSEFDESKANDFVKREVLPKLGPRDKRVTRKQMRDDLIAWVGDDIPTWVAYYAAYDAVCLFEMLSIDDTEGKGSFAMQPKGWPKLVWDLKQDIMRVGNPELPNQDAKGGHNALSDAQWLKATYHWLHGRYGLVIPEKKVMVHAAALEQYHRIMKSLGQKPVVEMIGDNTVDNLMGELKRTVATELGQFVGGLLNGSVNDFAYAYSMPQYAEFKNALDKICIRYKLMDGTEQGDMLVKIVAMFKDIFADTYAQGGPEAADVMATKYAAQMIEYLKLQNPQIADLANGLQITKVY